MRLLRAVVIGAMALGLSITTAGPALADVAPVTGVVVQHDDGLVRQRVLVADLYPTASRQVVFLLEGDDPGAARRAQISVTSLVDAENECNRPERNTGDTTCDGSQGELSQFLDLSFAPGREVDAAGKRSCTPAGPAVSSTLGALRSAPVVVGLPDDEGVLCLLATVQHAERADDNVTQTDSVEFDLRLGFDVEPVPATTDTEVLGTKFGPTVTPTEVDGGRLELTLPRTGFPAAMIGGGGLLLAGAGALLLTVARRSHQSESESDR